MLIALIQLDVSDTDTPSGRINAVERIFAGIKNGDRAPDLVMLPELWTCGFTRFGDYERYAQPERGEIYSQMSGWAKTLGCYIHTGSFVEHEAGRLYNTSLLIGHSGEIEARYRKLHLFGFASREPEILTAGECISLAKTGLGTVSLSTCYDLRFPEQYRAAARAGAEIFLVTAAWPLERLEQWRLFCRARAAENLCFLAACNSAGTLNSTESAGNSAVIDPWGETVRQACAAPQVLFAEIDIADVRRRRALFPAMDDIVDIKLPEPAG